MPNDTSTGGFLLASTTPETDMPLEDIFQAAIVGITGLPGNLVRPRIQAAPPNQPDFDVNWAAVGVTVTDQDTFSHSKHIPALETNGASIVSRDETLEVLVSFYGPLAHLMLSRWREGLDLDVNRWGLMAYGIKLQYHGQPIPVPALLKERWVRRMDFKATFSRRLKVTYPIRSIADAEIQLDNEYYITPIIVQQP